MLKGKAELMYVKCLLIKSNESPCIKSRVKSTTAKTFVTEITYLWDSKLHPLNAFPRHLELLRLNLYIYEHNQVHLSQPMTILCCR